MDAQLDVLAELLVELLEVVLVFANLLNQLHHLLDQVLADDLKNLVLLQHLPGNVQGQIFAVNNALDKVEVLWDDLLAVIHDEDPAYVQLDVVLSLLVLKEVKWRTLWNEEQGPELQL